MRTTLDIAEDVLFAARERARREQRSIGEVISDLARAALNAGPVVPAARAPKATYGFRPFPKRGGVVTNARIDQLREDDAS
jgi:hypothetical protein